MDTHLATTQTYTILITISDSLLRQTLSGLLQQDGYAVIETVDTNEALSTIQDDTMPNVVLIDASIAQAESFALCGQIRAMLNGQQIVIIVIHSMNDDDVIQQAFDIGVDDYILKPIQPVLLRQRIRRLLSHKTTLQAITAQKQNQERLQLALEAADDGVWDWNMQTGEVYYSPRWLMMLGYDVDDLPPDVSTWEQLMHPDDAPHVQQALDSHINDNSIYQIEHRLKYKDGDWKWIRAQGKVVERAEDGTPLRMIGTHKDIDERKRIEEALRENERRLSTLIENASDIIYSLAFTGEFLYVSSNWTEFLGHSPDEVIGVRFEAFVHPDDLEACEEFLRRVVETGKKHRGIEYRVQHKDGTWFWHTSAGTLARDENDEPLYYVGVAHDITEQKMVKTVLAENERRYRIISDTISDYAYSYVVNADNSLTKDWSTQAFHDITGYTWEEMDSDGWERITHPDDMEKALARFYRLLNGEVDVTEFRIFTKSGDIRWLRDHGHPYWDEKEGRVTHIYGAAQDITQSKLFEQQLQQQAIELKERNEELDAFAYTVAHDLKNPIASMMGFASLILNYFDRMPDDQVREYLHLIMEGGYKLKEIINALLLLAGVNKMEGAEISQLDMTELIPQVEARLSGIIEESQAIIETPDEWAPGLGYAPWVEEVWANYISNAIKYGGEPPYIAIGSERLSSGHIRYWVQDNGNGLTDDEQKRVFTPFTRLNQIKIEGHGLGLSVVHRIVEKLGGDVQVDSVIGEGSRFSFTLPAVDSHGV